MRTTKAARLGAAIEYLVGNMRCCDQPLRENSYFGVAVEGMCIVLGITDPKKVQALKELGYKLNGDSGEDV